MKFNSKNQSRRKRTVTRSSGLNDPRAMSTVRTRGPVDPPQTSVQIVGFKRIRKVVALPTGSGAGTITIGDIAGCLPLSTNNSEFRVLKMSVWGSDGSGSAGTQTPSLSCVFPVSNNPVTPLAPTPGDNAAWQDDGVFGQSRPHIHLTPSFEYRNYWLSPLKNGPGAIVASFVQTTGGTGSLSIVVDITLQFRTVVQACPALDHLNQIQSTHESTDEDDFDSDIH